MTAISEWISRRQDPSNNPFEGINEGLQKGMDLAAKQAQVDYYKQEAAMRKQDTLQKAQSMHLEYLNRIGSTDNAAYRKVLVDNYEPTFSKLNGVTLASPSTLGMLTSGEDQDGNNLKTLLNKAYTDYQNDPSPVNYQKIVDVHSQILPGQNPLDTANLVNTKLKDWTQFQNSKILAQKPLVSEQLKTVTKYGDPGDSDLYLNGTPEQKQAAISRAMTNEAKATAQANTDKSNKINSSISQGQQKIDETHSYHQVMGDAIKQRLDMQGKRLAQGDARIANLAVNNLDKNTKDLVPMVMAAHKGLQNLEDPNLNWTTFKESQTDQAGLMQAKLSSITPTSREQSIQKRTAQEDLDTILTYGKSSLVGRPPQAYVDQLKNAFNRLDRFFSDAYENRVNSSLSNSSAVGTLKDPNVANMLYQSAMDAVGIPGRGFKRSQPTRPAPKAPSVPSASSAPSQTPSATPNPQANAATLKPAPPALLEAAKKQFGGNSAGIKAFLNKYHFDYTE